LKVSVHYEDRFQMMNIFSLLSLLEDVNFWANGPGGDFGKLSLAIVGESTKLFDIDTSASSNVVSNVLNKCFPNNK